jgi:hypothetical protein
MAARSAVYPRTAVVTPLPGGRAHLSWRGVEHTFDDVFEALAECEQRRIRVEVLPFPQVPVAVTWTHPAFIAP